MSLRNAQLGALRTETFDVLVLGGGINGAVSTACLSAHGARVGLVERGDFASLTSQESSNLAWGGLKYLESFELGLVRKLCQSRNRLMRSYPASVREIRFFAVHPRSFRHGLWKLYLGAWLYWILGSFFTRKPRRLSTQQLEEEEPVVALEGCDGGFEYSDASLEETDARFVWSFVRSAMRQGATAANYVEALGSSWDGSLWTTRLRDVTSGATFEVRSRALVNACGPLVDDQNAASGQGTSHRHLLSKGVHLIVPRITDSRRVLTFFADDGRPFFVIPLGSRSCIGTTDTPAPSSEVQVTSEDRRFVLDNVNKRLRLPRPLDETDILAERCGVRPLALRSGSRESVDWLRLSRKHVVEVDAKRRHLSIFGGKLTDCLNVGEEVTEALGSLGLDLRAPTHPWFGEPGPEERARFMAEAASLGLGASNTSSSPEGFQSSKAARLWRRYGADAFEVLDRLRAEPSLGQPALEGSDVLRVEVDHAREVELVVHLEDFLRRRSQLALVHSREQLRLATGMVELASSLFGERAEAELERYFRTSEREPQRGEG